MVASLTIKDTTKTTRRTAKRKEKIVRYMKEEGMVSKYTVNVITDYLEEPCKPLLMSSYPTFKTFNRW